MPLVILALVLLTLACAGARDRKEVDSPLSNLGAENDWDPGATSPYDRPNRSLRTPYGRVPHRPAYGRPTYGNLSYKRGPRKKLTYGKRRNEKRPAYVPHLDEPTYEARTDEAPTYEAPTHEAPTYEAPNYVAPSYEAPTYEASTYEAPTDEAPNYVVPSFEAPTYEASTYEAPIYEVPAKAPTSGAPTYDAAPTYNKPNKPNYRRKKLTKKLNKEEKPKYKDDAAGYEPEDPCSAGMAQSPVDLTTEATIFMPTLNAQPFALNKAYYRTPRRMALVRDGKRLLVEFEDNFKRQMSGGGLDGTYILDNIHLHFGNNGSDRFSDHVINGKGSSAEMHFVHYKAEFQDLTSAIESNRRDALAVLAVFYDLRTGEHKISRLKQNFKEPEVGVKIPVEPLPLTTLLPDLSDFHRYHGSLTIVPPCNQVVAWTILTQSVARRPKDGLKFSKFMDQLTMASFGHFPTPRKIQPLNGRVVLRSVPGQGYN